MKNTDIKWSCKPIVIDSTGSDSERGWQSTESVQFKTVSWTLVKSRRAILLFHPSWIRWLTYWMLPNPGQEKSFLMQSRAGTLLWTFNLRSRRIQINIKRKIRKTDLVTKELFQSTCLRLEGSLGGSTECWTGKNFNCLFCLFEVHENLYYLELEYILC